MSIAKADKHEMHGIRRLAAALLVQAISDLHRGTVPNRRSATEWFEEGATGALSFTACCEILDRDAEDVRKNLLTDCGIPRAFLKFGPSWSEFVPAA